MIKKIGFKYTTTDLSNFDKRWSDARFVSVLFFFFSTGHPDMNSTIVFVITLAN